MDGQQKRCSFPPFETAAQTRPAQGEVKREALQGRAQRNLFSEN
jgi:hypothetical protein